MVKFLMVKFFLQTWKNYFKAVSKNISYSGTSLSNSSNYLARVEDIAREVCKSKNMEFERLPIADDEKIAGFHYVQFKKNFDGKPNDFEDVYLMEVIAGFYNISYGQFNKAWEDIYKNFKNLCSNRTKDFQDGVKIAQIKDVDKYDQFKMLFDEYLK